MTLDARSQARTYCGIGRWSAAVLACLLFSTVSGARTVTTAAASVPYPEVLKKLRGIETAALRGEADGLRKQFEEQVKAAPQDPLPKTYLAWCSMPSDAAWGHLKEVAALFPELPWAHYGMGRIYLRWKIPDQAERAFTTSLSDDKKFYPGLIGLGDALRREGKLAEAEKQYQRALELVDDPEAHTGLGLALLQLGRRVEAKVELKRALQLWPEQPEALLALGVLSRDEDPKGALQLIGKATQLAPTDKLARRHAAELLMDLGELDLAAKQYETVVRLGDKDPVLVKLLIDLYTKLHNNQGLERALRMMDSLDRKSAEWPLKLSALAEQRGAHDEAEGYIVEAVARDPRLSEARVQLARMLAKRLQFKEALDAYRSAQRAGPLPKSVEDEIATLAEQLRLPPSPLSGSVDDIYATVSNTVSAFYQTRLQQRATLAGRIKLRVRVDAHGKAQAVDTLEDTVLDPFISGHVYFALKDAEYPKEPREPVFEFKLRPPEPK